MSDIAGLVADHLDIWTAATDRRGAGRGGGKRIGFYGVERLRALILDLAVRGKLVPQDSNELHRPALLKLRTKQVEPTCPIPASWLCLPLSALGKQLGGGTPAKSRADLWDGPIPWVSPKDMKQDRIADTQMHVSEAALSTSPVKLVPVGSVLFVVRGMILAHSFPVALTDVPVTINQDMKAVVLHDPEMGEYLLRALKGLKQKVLAAIERSSHGTCRLDASVYDSLAIPVPPLAEQRRIVAKVDELMALCDALERKSADALGAHQTLVETLLATLIASPDASTLETEWMRLERCFDILFTTGASVDALKATVLDLAVRGKLTEQDAADQPVDKLLTRLGRPKAGSFSAIATKDEPFRLPAGWAWIPFGEYADEIATGPFGTMIGKADYVDGGVPLINPSHMIDDRIVEDTSVSLLPKRAETLAPYRLVAGDLVFARRGEVGRLALVTSREDGWLCGTGSFRVRFGKAPIQPYLIRFFRSAWARSRLGGASVGSTMSNLNQSILSALPVPVPPLAEQHRIVAKVDELTTLCDALKARIADADTNARQLADALAERAA